MAILLMLLVICNAFVTGWLVHANKVMRATIEHLANVQADMLKEFDSNETKLSDAGE